jgi:phosphate:Na+ symporter
MTELGVGSLLGGLGLFLLGMTLLSDGLRLAAGPALSRILASSTQTRWRGLMSGIMVTAMVQSSSAVTVAAIGFVNAGLLSFGQSLWVLFGANVGTTITGWLVALIGFKIKIEVAALPLIGIGMALQVSGAQSRRGAFGQALAGFGLLFLGIGFLQQAFSGVGQAVDLTGFADGGVSATLIMVLIGIVFTVLMQSSSAALAVVLTLAETDVLPLSAAAGAVIGANVGTTVTALLAAIGATSNARRSAAAHVLFNLLTGLVALLLLPILLKAVAVLSHSFQLDASPAAALALFHTLFNLLGVLLMWPVADHLAAFLNRRFVSRSEQISLPRYLDRNVATVPVLAGAALEREMERFGQLTGGVLKEHIDALLGNGKIPADGSALAPLSHAIGDFVTQVNRAEMNESTAAQFVELLGRQRHFIAVVDLLPDIAEAGKPLGRIATNSLRAPTQQLLNEALEQVALCASGTVGTLPQETFPAAYKAWKLIVLAATARGELTVETMDALLRGLSALRRAIDQLRKGVLVLRETAPAAA